MNDDMRDEVPVPHYENELWHTLAQVHAEQRSGRASGPGDAVRMRRRGRRLLLAGVGSIAAGAVAVAALTLTDSDKSPSTPDTETAEDPPPTEAPEMSLASQITAASQEASATSILFKRTDNHPHSETGMVIGDEETWTDEQSGARRDLSYDAEGQPSFDVGRTVAPTVDDQGPEAIPEGATPLDPDLPKARVRTVDHCFAQYMESDELAFQGQVAADQLGEQLEQGFLVEDGTEVVDGRELIRLVEVPVGLRPGDPPDGGRPGRSQPTTSAPADPTASTTTTAPAAPLDPDTFEFVEHIYLVDAETFRPAKIIGYPGEAPDYSDAIYVASIEYLPRTPENLAKLVAPIPDGFTQIDNLPGDGARYDQCGT